MPTVFYGRMSDYLEEKVAKMMCGEATFTAPSALYLALALYDSGGGLTTGWGETGAAVTEPSDGYARVQISGSDWSTPANDSFTETGSYNINYRYTMITTEKAFPEPTATWGTDSPRFAAIFDASTGGNLFWYFNIDNTTIPDVAPAPGQRVTFNGNTLRVGFPRRTFHGFNDDDSARNDQLWIDDVVDALLNHMTGKASYIVPTWYFGLVSEPSDAAYSRISMATNWNAVAADDNGFAFTNKEMNWGPVNTGSQWTGKRTVLYDASSSGNIATTDWTGLPTVNNGDTVRMQSGRVKLRFR